MAGVHKAGPLKQQNKEHKTGKHKSKSRLRRESHGQVSVIKLSKRQKKLLGKHERRLQAKQIRQNKREEVLNQKRTRGSAKGAPMLAVVIPLSIGLNLKEVIGSILETDSVSDVKTSDLQVTHFNLQKFRKRLSLVTPDSTSIVSVLDACKVADEVLFVVNADVGIDEWGECLLSCIFAQGVPAALLAVLGLKNLPQKKLSECRKSLQKTSDKWFSGEKFHAVDTDADIQVLLRLLSDHKISEIKWRDSRPHLLAESLTMTVNPDNPEVGTLQLSGYVRGQPLSVNGLVHLPGWGDFQMLQIDTAQDPYQLEEGHNRMDDSQDGPKVLERCNPSLQESLQSEVVPDPMQAEQTWPTEEELAEAEASRKQKKVPKGMSAYQATWIEEKEGITEDADEDDEEDDMEVDDADSCSDSEEDVAEEDEEYETLSVTEDTDMRYDAQLDISEDQATLNKYKEARMHSMFPDEVDTPADQPARIRFQKYRGLKSLRTSPWDPKENLPLDYARIYQFQNFKQARKRALNKAQEDGGALTGWYVTVHITNVPKAYMENYKPGHPLVVFGLLAHEQKMSVCHYTLHRHYNSEEPIKSKESMIFQVGYRRFQTCPVYSQHTLGDKHKFERFLPVEGVCVSSVYAPIMFSPAPVLMFKPNLETGVPKLVATGSLLSVNVDRIIAKRIVLSGHPFKINKKQAVVRYMFFTREDIAWFKPVELRTKWGRRGHIREPLGTHGHMKCVFDGQLKSQDSVLMNLYKRVYPKWTYNGVVSL